MVLERRGRRHAGDGRWEERRGGRGCRTGGNGRSRAPGGERGPVSVGAAPQRETAGGVDGPPHRPDTVSARPRVAIYAVDQDPGSTRSRGIYNHTRNLIRALVKLPEPGFELVLLLSGGNSEGFLPRERPSWLSVHVTDGTFGRGWRRLFADHVLVDLLAARLHLDLVHFPKGWVPAIVPRRLRVVATLHDAIPAHYRRKHPAVDPWRFRYFAWQTVRTLRCADVILTISRASARQLAALGGARPARIRVIPEGPGLPLPEPLPIANGRRKGLMVFGSRAPHKRTLETFELIRAWAEARSADVRVTVAGLERMPDGWNVSSRHVRFRFLGPVSDALLIEELQ
ncbi:MAG TPA: hypothetical protein ENK19_09260, partial [Acidobacteria bacterium]|nr:hypothetical protein [Acidobacteriota bacterium]